MKNDARIKHEDKEGIYEEYETVYEKRSWKSKSTTSAIWFIPAYNTWAIGNLEDIGGKRRQLTSVHKYYQYKGRGFYD